MANVLVAHFVKITLALTIRSFFLVPYNCLFVVKVFVQS
jgi:hypothetical protein